MRHRHLIHERHTLAAIDDIIQRGKWRDWVDLRRASLDDRGLLEKMTRVCRPHVSDPRNQRHVFWMRYVDAAMPPAEPNAVSARSLPRATHRGGAGDVLVALRERFDRDLVKLEGAAVSLDGIETVVRHLVRSEPFEMEIADVGGERVIVPTGGEVLRIKGALILKRNAMQDLLEFVLLADRMGSELSAPAMARFDEIYPQKSGESALQQLLVQVAGVTPSDVEEKSFGAIADLPPALSGWQDLQDLGADIATSIFDRVCELEAASPASEAVSPSAAGSLGSERPSSP